MTVFERVKRIIAEVAGIDEGEIKLLKRLKEDLNLDSLNRVELLIALEEEFGQEITDQEAQGLETVEQIVDFIEKRFQS